MTEPAPAMLLPQAGTVYVTLAAAQTYAAARGLGVEEARRELTVHAHNARPVDVGSAKEKWRIRKPVDASLIVIHDGPLAVIVSIGRVGKQRTRRRKGE